MDITQPESGKKSPEVSFTRYELTPVAVTIPLPEKLQIRRGEDIQPKLETNNQSAHDDDEFRANVAQHREAIHTLDQLMQVENALRLAESLGGVESNLHGVDSQTLFDLSSYLASVGSRVAEQEAIIAGRKAAQFQANPITTEQQTRIDAAAAKPQAFANGEVYHSLPQDPTDRQNYLDKLEAVRQMQEVKLQEERGENVTDLPQRPRETDAEADRYQSAVAD